MTTQAQVVVRPQKVFCVIEHSCRDLGLAKDVCLGRFTHAGITVEIGTDPDWLSDDLPEDEEWRIEWSKFYYGLDLAYAFNQTGERRFLQAWEKLISSWIRQVPVDFDPTDVIGRRIQNWIYAWNLFAESPQFFGLSDGLEQIIITSLKQQTVYLRRHLSAERNHRTLELYALFVGALALPQISEAGELLQFSIRELCENLLKDIRPDGVHREQSSHYHMLALRSFLAALENAKRFSLSFPAGYSARLESACEFAMHLHRPDGEIPALSDSDTGSFADVLELAGSLLSRPDFTYAATAGAEGTPPARRYVSFTEGGYHVQRSGWGCGKTSFKDERFLIFDCGSIGDGGHGHYDLLSVEISAAGLPLVVDPGRYTYAEQNPNLRRWFKGTAAHNTVCVDGMDQVPYRRGKPKPPFAQAKLVERLSAPGFDMLCGVATSPSYEVVHTRRIFFVNDEYWIIYDRLRSLQPHHYDLRFHLAPQAWGHTTLLNRKQTAVVHTPGLALVFEGGHKLGIQPGWVAPRYGVKVPAPVVSVVTEGSASTEFFTLVVPARTFEDVPSLQVCHDRGDGSDALCVQVSNVGPQRNVTDRVIWSSSIGTHELGAFVCRASAVWMRSVADGSSPEVVACNVQELRWADSGKAEFLTGLRASPWIAWDQQHGLFDTGGSVQ
jgi:hypothetical protein